jgi:type III secretion protein R
MGDAGSGVMLALAALVPLVALMLTSFVKVSVVLALVRNALGASEAPSGFVVLGLSLVLTLVVMTPVATQMVEASAAPAVAPPPATDRTEIAVRTLAGADHQAEVDRALRSLAPLRAFLTKHADERDRTTFLDTARKLGHDARGDELSVLAPAFVATELREAFAIAVLIFLPFLVIDLVVGLGLAALGLAASSPQAVALPLKLLLFVAVDGWRLLLDGLLRGYV